MGPIVAKRGRRCRHGVGCCRAGAAAATVHKEKQTSNLRPHTAGTQLMRTSALFISIFVAALGAHADVVRCTDAGGSIVYTDGPCPPGSRLSRQVPIAEAPPPAARRPSEDVRLPDSTPPPSVAPPSPTPGNTAGYAPPGLAIIPRNPDAQPVPVPAPVFIWGQDPYYDRWYPAYRRPPRPHLPPYPPDPGPGQRPCQNLAGIKRYNC